MADISKGFYDTQNPRIYVTEDNFIWEYKWFYHENYKGEEVYLVAHEYKTNTTLTTPIKSEQGEDLSPIIMKILDERTSALKG